MMSFNIPQFPSKPVIRGGLEEELEESDGNEEEDSFEEELWAHAGSEC